MKNCILILLFFIGVRALASGQDIPDSTSLLTEQEKQIHLKVKTRDYPGGMDEEALRVQAQLPSVSRKMQPAQEPIENDEPSGGASSESEPSAKD